MSDGEDRALALVVLAERRIDARQEHRKAKGLREIIIGARIEPLDLVGLGVVPGQHQHRAGKPLLAHQFYRIATVHVGQADIKNGQFHIVLAQDF
ncbi:hypothetical protein D3C86_1797970 [compost metagenome]